LDNIKTGLQELGWGDMYWIEVAQEREVISTCKCGNEPSGCIKFGDYLD
jgi:hypothetical protein